MKKNGFAGLIIIIAIAILGIVGYFAYDSHLVKLISFSDQTQQTTTEAVTNSKVTINAKVSSGGSEKSGTMIVPSDWQFSQESNKGNQIPDLPLPEMNTITIKKDEYSISIGTLVGGRGLCTFKEETNVISFFDREGNKYLRKEGGSEICSNGITSVSEGSSDIFGSGEAVFGSIKYNLPQNPEETVVKQMDNIVASFQAST